MESLATSIANQFREVHLDGTWIANTNLRNVLKDVTWEMAITKIGSLNTIASLVYHLNYYVVGLVNVLEGGTLDIKDKYSFDMPTINSHKEWETMLSNIWEDAEKFATLISELSDYQINGPFVEQKYGTYYRNLTGMIEHAYYHLGQIVLIKKMLQEKN